MALISIEHDGPVVRVILNRPDVRNALSDELIGELRDWAEGITAAAAAKPTTMGRTRW